MEHRFTSAQDYFNYDFDDSFCFFYKEMVEYIESIEKIDPAPIIDCPQKIADLVKDLLKIYDVLIINLEEERLYGEINGERFLVKEGMHEEGCN